MSYLWRDTFRKEDLFAEIDKDGDWVVQGWMGRLAAAGIIHGNGSGSDFAALFFINPPCWCLLSISVFQEVASFSIGRSCEKGD